MHVAHARCGGVLSVAGARVPRAHSRWSGCFLAAADAGQRAYSSPALVLCDVEYCTAYRSSTARFKHTHRFGSIYSEYLDLFQKEKRCALRYI